MKVKSIIETLQKHYSDTDEIAVAIWTIDDVLDRAEEMGNKITRDQAEKVVYALQSQHDANIGINWDVIDTHISMTE